MSQVVVRAVDIINNEIEVEALRRPAKKGEEVLQHCNCQFLDLVVDGAPRVYIRVDEKMKMGEVQVCIRDEGQPEN